MESSGEIIEKMGIVTSTERTTKSPCPICNGAGYLIRDVPVGHPDFGKLIPCRCKIAELEARRQAELQKLSNLGELSRMTFENFVPEGYGLNQIMRSNLRNAYETALAFAEEPKGWLVIMGGYGCGKTHLAAAIANYRLQQGEPALFVVVPDLLDHLRATYSPHSPIPYDERFEMVRTAPLLILDDLGTQSTTSWAQEKLFQIFNHRYNSRLPTVITFNQKLEDIDVRLRSRLVDPDLSIIVTILAPDFRRSGGDALDRSELSTLTLHSDQTFENFKLRRGEINPEDQKILENALDIARDYAQAPKGWLVLRGPIGCGKTHLAAAIANHWAKSGHPVLFVVVPDLLDHLRATYSPTSTVTYDKRFEEIRTAPFLVLDDLGTESATPWAKEKLYQIFNYRYNARLPTVITTTYEMDSAELDPRLRSRMLDETRCTVVNITVPSYRGGLKPTKRAPSRSGVRRNR